MIIVLNVINITKYKLLTHIFLIIQTLFITIVSNKPI